MPSHNQNDSRGTNDNSGNNSRSKNDSFNSSSAPAYMPSLQPITRALSESQQMQK